MFKNKTLTNTIIGTGISVFFLFLVLRDVDFVMLQKVLFEFNWWILGVGLIVWLVGYGIRAWRWQVLLKPVKAISWRNSFEVLVIGFTANNLLPLRAGEFVRAFLLGKKENISKTTVFATVAAERLFDGIIIVSLTILGASVVELPTWMRQTILISAGIFILALIAFVFLIFFNQQTMKIVELLLRVVPASPRKPIYNLLNVFTAGIEFLRNPKTLFLVLLSSLFIWITEAGFYYLAAISFGFDISVLQALFLKGILNLGILVPSAPGYVGTFEFFIVEAMALIGVSETPALGYALVSHFVEFASISIVGIFFWIKYGLSLSDIKKESKGN